MKAPGWDRQALGALTIALVSCLVLILATISRYGYNPSALIWLGEESATAHPTLVGPGIVVMKDSPGYDGQFFYFIAQDPFLQRKEFTVAERYQRIGYPLLADVLALGQRSLLPHALVLANLAAILVGTWALQRTLRPLGQSPWLSLLLGINSGNLLSLQQDLSDALAITLGVGALLCYQRRRLGWTAALLATAMLTRESAILFLLTLGAWELLERRFSNALLLSLSLVPHALYQFYLATTLGEAATFASSQRIATPFSGMAPVLARLGSISSLREAVHPLSIMLVMVLIVAALVFSLWRLAKGGDVFALGVLLHALFAISASYGIWEGYASAGRVFAGIYPFLILSHVTRPRRGSRALLALSACLSLLTLVRPFFTPAGAYYVT